MDDDFNTGGAVGSLYELLTALNRFADVRGLETAKADPAAREEFVTGVRVLRELSQILGLFWEAPKKETGGNDQLVGGLMQLLLDLRAEARKAKNFATADAIRDGLAPTGIKLEDRAGGTEWSGGAVGALDAVMQMLIKLRQTARANKDFATGDAIRNRLTAIGVKLEDRPGGVEWTRA